MIQQKAAITYNSHDLQGLDNKNMDADMTGVDTNKVAESIYAEKTAKLHRLLGEKEEKGFRLDLESPESEKLTDSVSEKEEKEVDEVEEEKEKTPVRRRVKNRSELPLGLEKHEVSGLLRFSNCERQRQRQRQRQEVF